MRSKASVLEIFCDKYYQQYFPSRNSSRVGDEWAIAGIGFLSDDELAGMILVAKPPLRAPYKPNWWQRLIGMSIPDDELEVLARYHVWTIKRQCDWLEENRQALQQSRFKSSAVLEKMLKESRAGTA